MLIKTSPIYIYRCKRVEKLPSKDMYEHFTAMKNLEIRDDDIYLATYEKAGQSDVCIS